MHGQNMQEQNDIRRVLNEALQALNSKENKTAYFDLHDDSLITHGIPGNFSADKEGMEEYYREVWRALCNKECNTRVWRSPSKCAIERQDKWFVQETSYLNDIPLRKE
jgi:hypothetical protein